MANYDNTNQKGKYHKNPGTIKRQSASVAQSAGLATKEKDDDLQDILKFIRANKPDMDNLSNERESIMKQYLGDKYGNEIAGRSQVVITEIANKIEAMMPVLMKIFYGGQNVVEVRPQGEDDEEKAKLMEEKLNFDFQKSNNGYRILYEWFKDALMFKYGVVKYWWKNETIYEKPDEYKGLNDQDFRILSALLSQQPNIEIVKVDSTPIEMKDPMTGLPVQMGNKYDVKVRKFKKVSQPCFENLPLEEFIFDIRDTELKRAVHKKKMSRKDFKKQYGKTDDDIKAIEDSMTNTEAQTRFEDLGGSAFMREETDKDNIYLYEYQDNEKIITFVGEEKLDEQENKYDKPTYCLLSPIIMPHRIIGRCPADQAVQGQKVKTALMRGILDNIYYQNNGMKIVNPYRISMEDIANNNVPGGTVRTLYDIDPNSAVVPMPVEPLAPQTLKAWELNDAETENETGITKYNQGMDSKSLNRTASGISQIMGASMQRMELIARTFAETGVRDLFQSLVDMNIKFFDMETNIKLNENWITITPDMIDGNFDVVIDIAVGTGSKEMVVQQMDAMLNSYGMIASIAGPMVFQVFTLENVREILKEKWQAMGWKNANKFVAPEGQQMGGMIGQAGIIPQIGQGEAGQGTQTAPVGQPVPAGY